MSILRLLKAAYAVTFGNAHYERKVVVRGRSVRFANRGDGAHMGRFGGGWEREVGFQLGSRGVAGTIVINLWKGSIRIDPKASS